MARIRTHGATVLAALLLSGFAHIASAQEDAEGTGPGFKEPIGVVSVSDMS